MEKFNDDYSIDITTGEVIYHKVYKIKDIFDYIKKYDHVEECISILSNDVNRGISDNGTTEGFIFELIVQMCIVLKVSDFGEVEYLLGNLNKNNGKILRSLKSILNKHIRSGKGSGFSDIHFNKNGKIHISSSKYFQDDNKKMVSNYDLNGLSSIALNSDNDNFKFLLFVKNKQKFLDIYKKSDTSTKKVYEKHFDPNKDVYGTTEIQLWYDKLRNLLNMFNYDLDYIDREYIDTNRKSPKILYDHQKIATTELLNAYYYNFEINKNPKRGIKFLLNCLQGQGKTTICIEGFMLELIKKGKKLNYLLNSHRPSLFPQWTKIIYDTLGFEDTKIIDFLRDFDQYNDEEWVELIQNGNNFISLSTQGYTKILNDPSDRRHKRLINTIFDIEFRDETQEGFETGNFENVSKLIKSNFIIYNSGTSQKNEYFQFFDHKFVWGLLDIFECIKTGKHNGNIINDHSLNFYKSLPELRYMIYEWSDEFIRMLHASGYPKNEYPTPSKVFEIKDGKFKYENEIRYWIKNVIGNGLTRKGYLFDGPIKGTTIITLDNKNQQYLLKELLNDEINSLSDNFKIHIINSGAVEGQTEGGYSSLELIDSVKNLAHGIYGRILIIVDQLRVGANIEYEIKQNEVINDLHTIITLDSLKSYPINFQTHGRLLRVCIGKSFVRIFDPWPYRAYNLYNNIIKNNSKKTDEVEKNSPIFLESLPIYHNGTKLSDKITEYYKMLARYSGSEYYNEDLKNWNYRVQRIYNYDIARKYTDIIFKLFNCGNKTAGLKIKDGIGDEELIGKSFEKNKKNGKNSFNDVPDMSKEDINNYIASLYNSILYLPFLTNFKEISFINIINNIEKYNIYIGKKKINSKDFYEKDILLSNVGIIEQLIEYGVLNINEIDNHIKRIFDDYEKINNGELTISEKLEIQYKLIEEYRGISTIEKKLHGEVFTPFELIDEMLDTLPSWVWKDKTLKWLDPANGIGNFPFVIVRRLMDGLKDVILDENERYRHILEKMIYACDIQTKNMFIYLMLFDSNNEYKMNYYRGSYLSKEFDELGWGEFDIIIGNPPYQESHSNGKSNRSSLRLWAKFTIKSLKTLKENGFLLFITPSGWAGSTSAVFNLIKNKELIFANFSSNISKSFGNVGGSMIFTYFLIKNKEKNMLSKIKFDQGITEIDIFNMKITPIKSSCMYDFTILDKMLNSSISGANWKRNDDKNKKIDELSIIMHRSKSENTDVEFSNELEDRSGFWLFGEKDYLEIIKHNINLPIYKRFRWVVRSGMAIANNIKYLPIPFDKKYTQKDLSILFNFNENEIKYLEEMDNKYSKIK